MNLRQVCAADRDEWLRLLGGLHPGEAPAALAVLVDAFLTGGPCAELLPAVVFVLERPEGGLAGILEVSVRNMAEGCTGDTPYLESWYVDPDCRGQGLGRALVQAAEDWARAQGYTEIASDTWHDNLLSQAAHQALGFEMVEQIVCFRKAL